MAVQQRNTTQNQVVNRYNTSVVGIFIAIVFAAIIIAVYWYSIELESYQKDQQDSLEKQANLIDNILSRTTDSLLGLREFSNHYLVNVETSKLTMPELKQDGEYFHLDAPKSDIFSQQRNLSANITGIADLAKLNESLQAEIAMAYALTPAFVTAQYANDEANWFYYVSLNRFVSLYPWISRNNWQYSDRMLESNHMRTVINADPSKEEYHWSPPYVDSAGKGLNTALGIPVSKDGKVFGAMVIDISLARLHEHLTPVLVENEGVILLDTNNNVLVHEKNDDSTILSRVDWKSIVEEDLKSLDYQQIASSERFLAKGKWLIQHQPLRSNDWLLIRYQLYEDFTDPIFSRFIVVFSLLFIGLLALLLVVYIVTRKTFIKPAQDFINHIEHSARGDHGKVKPPVGWQHWYSLVENIFSENRSLFQQLKDQNEVLDERVNEKTLALRKKSEQHQHDYAILRSVIDAIPDYVIFNDLWGNIIGCNHAFEGFVNNIEHVMLQQPVTSFLPQSLAEVLDKNHQELQKNRKAKIGVFDIVVSDESTFEVFSTEFIRHDGQPLGNIDIIRDVTTQHEINAALAKAKDQAELANKAKSQFLANMSHEIRTPINAIQGMHFMLEQSTLSTAQQQHLNNAQLASVALLHLVDELLDFAKIESGKMTIVKSPASIDRIVNQAVTLNSGMLKNKPVEMVVDIALDVPEYIDTDEMRLAQVITNLLNNAAKFTSAGTIKVSVKAELDNLIFCVEDSGIGIAEDKQDRLFEAFRQADESMTRKYGGSGLGLSICQQIVNLLGGDIALTSQLGKGSCFTFNIPTPKISYTSKLEKLKAIQFVSVGQFLSDNFCQQISELSHLFTVDSYADVAAIKAEQLVLLIDGASITNETGKQLKSLNNIDNILVAVMSSDRDAEAANYYACFDQEGLNYCLCQVPASRYTLINIAENVQEQEVIETAPLVAEETSNSLLSGKRILLVEDNIVNQMVATELLKTLEVDVTVAENGEEALKRLETAAFDLILMDIQMPVMDGLTATKKIKEQEAFAALPIIAMTAHAREEDKMESLAAGMCGHVAKPVTADVLEKAMLVALEST